MNRNHLMGIPRRKFLAWGSSCAAAGLAPLGWMRGTDARTPSADGAERLSAAYCSIDEGGKVISPPIDARALLAGDSRFETTGARVRFLGSLSGDCAAVWGDLRSLSVGIEHRPYHEVLFHAWSMRAGTPSSFSPSAAFTAPIDAGFGLQLRVDVARGTEPEPQSAAISFFTGGRAGRPKLRRGLYLLGWPKNAGEAPPRWDARGISIENATMEREGATAPKYSGLRVTPIDLPCVAFYVDRARV